tara:strand:- start:631 stop:1002 length:372 start_codon:yes stop_codon:yes gene_type:complete
MEVLKNMPVVRPVKDRDEFIKLNNEALEDRHLAIAPTHVFEKSGDIIGYANVGTMTPVNTWFHSKKCKARDSLQIINVLENMVRISGSQAMLAPVSNQSPFLPVMDRFGYINMGSSNLMLKTF